MDSARKELYKLICETLALVSDGGFSPGFSLGFDTQNATALQWIDLWKRQEPDTGNQQPYTYPAAFVQIGRIDWQDMTFNRKEGRVTLNILVFFEKFGSTFNGATDRDTSLEILDTLDACEQAMQWMRGEAIKEVSLVGQEDLTEQYDRPAYRLSFETMIYERYKLNNYVLNAT